MAHERKRSVFYETVIEETITSSFVNSVDFSTKFDILTYIEFPDPDSRYFGGFWTPEIHSGFGFYKL